jgi:replicative DNA helicase
MTVDFANLPDQPRFPAAESAVLGALMLSASSADKLLPILREEHFTSAPHRDTLAAVRALWERQEPIDPVLVHDQLRKDGHVTWGETKAALFIHQCVEATYFPGNGTSYATTVLEYAARRRTVEAGIRIAQAAAQGRAEPADLIKLIAQEVHDIAERTEVCEAVRATAIAPTLLIASIREAVDQQLLRVHGSRDAAPERAALSSHLSRSSDTHCQLRDLGEQDLRGDI